MSYKHHKDTRFMPNRLTGLVASPNDSEHTRNSLYTHAANAGRVDRAPVDPRVGSRSKTGLGVPVTHGQMYSRTRGGDFARNGAHAAELESGATSSFKDTLKAPPKVFADPKPAYGMRSRHTESFTDAKGPGINHILHQGKGADEFAHALGRKILEQAMPSGSSVIPKR